MDTATILECIHLWSEVHKDGRLLVDYFSQGNCFLLDKPEKVVNSNSLHVYPGIFQGDLMFFVIPEEYDKEEYSAVIDQYVTVCPVSWRVAGIHTISASEANYRIKLWEDNYETWVPEQASTVDGVFLAFDVAVIDFEEDTSEMILALKPNGQQGIAYDADLIVEGMSPTSTSIKYDDYVRSVPPYSPAAMSSSFYLLNP
ncbi:MAG: hypothetical protein EOO45_09455 [Flavobacterium sp.]|nr:MAG: hypothetical protein EOO45_09455 [Flavobacterium sp.]